MGQTVMEMINLAVSMVFEGDAATLDAISEMETQVDAMEQEMIKRVILTIGLENPVAHDLFLVTTALSVVGELEKVGDEAFKLGLRISKLRGDFPYEMREMLQEMTKQVQNNMAQALRLFGNYSAEGVELVRQQEEAVDRNYKTSRNLILVKMKEHPDELRQYLRCVEVFHALEHVSDHVSDIAKSLRAANARIE